MSGVEGKVHLTHPDTGGTQLAPAESVPLWTARGWVADDVVPEYLDPDAPNRGAVPDGLEAAGPVDPDADAEYLTAAAEADPAAALVEHELDDHDADAHQDADDTDDTPADGDEQ